MKNSEAHTEIDVVHPTQGAEKATKIRKNRHPDSKSYIAKRFRQCIVPNSTTVMQRPDLNQMTPDLQNETDTNVESGRLKTSKRMLPARMLLTTNKKQGAATPKTFASGEQREHNPKQPARHSRKPRGNTEKSAQARSEMSCKGITGSDLMHVANTKQNDSFGDERALANAKPSPKYFTFGKSSPAKLAKATATSEERGRKQVFFSRNPIGRNRAEARQTELSTAVCNKRPKGKVGWNNDVSHKTRDNNPSKKTTVRKLSYQEKYDLYNDRPDLSPYYMRAHWPTDDEATIIDRLKRASTSISARSGILGNPGSLILCGTKQSLSLVHADDGDLKYVPDSTRGESFRSATTSNSSVDLESSRMDNSECIPIDRTTHQQLLKGGNSAILYGTQQDLSHQGSSRNSPHEMETQLFSGNISPEENVAPNHSLQGTVVRNQNGKTTVCDDQRKNWHRFHGSNTGSKNFCGLSLSWLDTSPTIARKGKDFGVTSNAQNTNLSKPMPVLAAYFASRDDKEDTRKEDVHLYVGRESEI